MKVSVVIRTYNRAHIIADALSSVLQQTHRDLEVIVVDDGSTDDTHAVVSGLADDRVRYVRHERNKGVGAAGNTGIQLATGEVVANLDSDDTWRPDMLETMVDFLAREPEAGVVFCGLDVVRPGDSAGEAPEVEESSSPPDAFRRLLSAHADPDEIVFTRREMYLVLLETVPLKPTTTLIRRDVLEDCGGYDESLRSGEDWELYRRICERHRFGYVARRLATMRVQEDSTLARMQEHDKRDLLAWERREKRAVRRDREAVSALDRAMSGHYDVLGHTYLNQRRRWRASITYFGGFVETRSVRLGVRAGWALAPRSLILGLVRVLRPAHD